MSTRGGVTVVLGAQWGDEGKGKLIDILSAEHDIVCRCQGGNNAGHTVVVDDGIQRIAHHFHLLPAGAANPRAQLLIGNGCVVHLADLFEEIDDAKRKDARLADIEERLIISPRTHIVTDLHKELDAANEHKRGKDCIGTTRKGIGPCYASKAARVGIRITDFVSYDLNHLLTKYECLYSYYNREYTTMQRQRDSDFYEAQIDRIRAMCKYDLSVFLIKSIDCGKKVLIEGANGAMLDIDFGTYPYVTSSNCTIGGTMTGLGIPPHLLTRVIGVMKAYTTRVGDGPFPTEIKEGLGEKLRQCGREVGVTTGRNRRCGWLDLVQMRHSILINGYTELMMTKLDVLTCFEKLKICTAYKHANIGDGYPYDCDILNELEPQYAELEGWVGEDIGKCASYRELPKKARSYVEFVENELKIHIRWIGVGEERKHSLRRD